MFAASSVSTPSPTLRILDHRHPDRVAGDVAEVVAALGEALRHRAMHVVRRRAGLSAVFAISKYSSYASSIVDTSGVALPSARDTSTQCPPGRRPRATGRRDPRPCRCVRSRTRVDQRPCSSSAGRSPADEQLLRPAEHLGGRLPGAYASECMEALGLMRTLSRTDSSSASDFTARARSNSTSHGHELGSAVERGEVADGHDLVEAVHADALAAQPAGEPLAGPVDEPLVGDPRVAVLADVPRLAREDDRRLALERSGDVRVAVHDRRFAGA